MKKQKQIAPLLTLAAMVVLICDSRTVRISAEKGVELCIYMVIPSLFPFVFLTNILSGFWDSETLDFLRPISKLFHLPDNSEHLLISMLLGGYPVGAQSVATAWETGRISLGTAQRLLGFCSNVGPSFLFGILTQKFQSAATVWLIWGVQIVSIWIVSQIFMGEKMVSMKQPESRKQKKSSIEMTILSIGKICGWVILFRIVISFYDTYANQFLPVYLRPYVIGLLELANGCFELDQIADERIRFIAASGILSFGGFCVMLQTMSVCKGLHLKYYVLGKSLQGVLSAAIAASIVFRIWIIPIVLITAAGLKKHLAFCFPVLYNKLKSQGGSYCAVSKEN